MCHRIRLERPRGCRKSKMAEVVEKGVDVEIVMKTRFPNGVAKLKSQLHKTPFLAVAGIYIRSTRANKGRNESEVA